jgi:hypothetical protein
VKHLEDKHCCPHCGEPLYKQPYIMARSAKENVLSLGTIAWIVSAILVLLLIVNAGAAA